MAKRALVVLVLLIVLCGAALADQVKLSVAVTGGAFFPTASSTQRIFGDVWPRLSVGTMQPSMPREWQLTADLSGFTHTDVGRARLYPLTVGVQRRLNTAGSAQTYAAVRIGPYYGKVEAPAIGVSANDIGFNANAAVGVIFKERYFVEARYDYFSHFAGFDFEGPTVSAGVRLFDIKL